MFNKLTSIPKNFFSRDGKRLSKLAYFFLFMLCIAFFTPGIVTMPPTDRDESSFAQASKQMIETGNYTDIKLQKEPRYKKPIGIYWLQSLSARLLSPHHLNEIWAYRVPSFIGATVAVLMTAALGALLFSPGVGLSGAMMLAGSILLNVEARLATTDAALLGSIMVAMYAMARAYKGKARDWDMAILFWTAISIGILLKGPIILLPVLGVLGWLKVTDKKIEWTKALKPLSGFIYMLILVAPWFITISMQSRGDFLQQSAGNDMLAKIWQGQNRGIMPPGMHLMALPITFFPYVLFVLLAIPDIWKKRREKSVKFCLGWLVPVWILFELPLTKLPHYVLPLFPVLALLAADSLMEGFPKASKAEKRWPIALIVALWIMFGLGFAAFFAMVPAFTDHVWVPEEIAAGLFLVVMQVIALALLPTNRVGSLGALTAGALVFVTFTAGDMVANLQHVWMSRQIVETATQVKPCAEGQIVAVGYHEPSLVFLGGTDTILASSGADAAKDLRENSCRVAFIDADDKQAFLDGFAGSKLNPHEVRTLEGLNSGHGAQAALTAYVAVAAP